MKKSNLQTWQTWWSIAGPKLPDKEIRFGKNAVIGPISAEAEKRALRAPQVIPPAVAGMCVFHSPPMDRVQSLYRLQIDISEKNEGAALRAARNLASSILTSLTISIGGRYVAELRMFTLAGTGHDKSSWYETSGVNIGEPETLSFNEATEASTLSDLFHSDQTANAAFQHIQAAWQLQSTPGSKPLQAPTLLQYVLCVEAVVNGVMPKIRAQRAKEIDQDCRDYAEFFLSTVDNSNKKAKAIVAAATELRRISLLNTIPSIELVGNSLGVPSNLVQEAMDLYKFRSSKIGHPGRVETKAFHKWLTPESEKNSVCLADAIARAYLKCYCSAL